MSHAEPTPAPTPGDPGQGDERRSRLLVLSHTPEVVAERARKIYDDVLERSKNLSGGNFTAISPGDLRLLFDLYDAAFFDGLLSAMLRTDRARLSFRLSRRMTRVAGTTTVLRQRSRSTHGLGVPDAYEIAISSELLFGSFRDVARPVTVGGLVCRDRLEALQRIFEHELLHLAEFLAWGHSSCSQANFQQLSQQIFAHEGVAHDLVTPRERAVATYDVRPGDRVSFWHEGIRRVGRVNRITRRATVLVEDPSGEPYSDGRRYQTFYVPLASLQREGDGAAGMASG
jgi:hypothetical protein